MKSAVFAPLALFAACQSVSPNHELDGSRPNRAFGFDYHAEVSEIPEGAKDVRLWIPIPLDTHDQEITDVTLTGSSGSARFTLPSSSFEAKSWISEQGPVTLTLHDIEHGQGRSLCVETDGKPIDLNLHFNVRRYETSPHKEVNIDEAKYLGADKRIPLDGNVSEMAKGLTTDANPMTAARQLYDHTLERMRYDKPAGGEWGRGDAEWACDSRHGNCTDFHSYFMGLARSKNIPARFEMGFPISAGGEKQAEVKGYHCWAYFWDEDNGWVPVDISEADKHPEKAEYFFGKIDENRVAMSGGRDLLLTPRPKSGSLNFFVYPFAEIDGKVTQRVKKSFKRTLLP